MAFRISEFGLRVVLVGATVPYVVKMCGCLRLGVAVVLRVCEGLGFITLNPKPYPGLWALTWLRSEISGITSPGVLSCGLGLAALHVERVYLFLVFAACLAV